MKQYNKQSTDKCYNVRVSKKNIPIKFENEYNSVVLKKPSWMKVKFPSNIKKIKKTISILRKHRLYTVCEQALCPNLPECFNRGTATFMILGSICSRKCTFCAVNYGKPLEVNKSEPKEIAQAIYDMKIKHVVITSVARDDLEDKGAKHFSNCIEAIRKINSDIKIEILVPDFKHSEDNALKIISVYPPNIFNHNLENVPRLYKLIRPGANYIGSLRLLEKFKILNPKIITKSGLMLGLGETSQEVIKVMKDLFNHGVTILTLGQYLQPSSEHLPVQKYITPSEFFYLEQEALSIGFKQAFCGPFVRSSYHADTQFQILK